jgi:hypothetical protein
MKNTPNVGLMSNFWGAVHSVAFFWAIRWHGYKMMALKFNLIVIMLISKTIQGATSR